MEQHEVTVTLEALEGYEFRVAFEPSGVELVMDEPEPLGGGRGPNASQALSAAIGNCLSASLLFCLQKAHIRPEALRTIVRTAVGRNEEGRLRVQSSDVSIQLELDPADRARVGRCLDVFEDYCVVTQAVRRGIEVDVGVVDDRGQELARTSAADAS